MKNTTIQLVAMLGVAATAPAVFAADAPAPAREEKRELRVITGPERERRVFVREGERREKPEMEKVAFLGVEASPVSPTLGSQLGLARGTGLVVGHVAPRSPAAGALEQHDILLQIDDQILIETRQLAVLVRNHREGDEVTITYLRGGKKATARIKLGTHEVPKLSLNDTPSPQAFAFHGGPGFQWFERAAPGGEFNREEVDRVLSLIRRAPVAPEAPAGPVAPAAPAPPAVRMQIERRSGPGVRAIAVHPGNSSLTFSDQEGALELTLKDGTRNLIARDAKGEQVFSGPVSTPEQRQALPAGLRERLERLEGMQEMTFKTDGDFQGAETRVFRPPGRAISAPATSAPSRRVSEPL